MEAFSDRNQINLARTRSHPDPHLQFPAALKEKDFQIKKRERFTRFPAALKGRFHAIKKSF
jgi:predicted mannosyl-3-phosphoglycerate phosphatase (HAD superfamily)